MTVLGSETAAVTISEPGRGEEDAVRGRPSGAGEVEPAAATTGAVRARGRRDPTASRRFRESETPGNETGRVALREEAPPLVRAASAVAVGAAMAPTIPLMIPPSILRAQAQIAMRREGGAARVGL